MRYNEYVVKRGFTIIVVLAGIGLLTAVIFARLNDARDLGIDAKIRAEINLISKRASIDFNDVGDYDQVCGTNGFTQNADITDLIASIEARANSLVVCNSDIGRYAVSAPLLQAGNWYIDSTGASHEIAAPIGVGVLVYPAS